MEILLRFSPIRKQCIAIWGFSLVSATVLPGFFDMPV